MFYSRKFCIRRLFLNSMNAKWNKSREICQYIHHIERAVVEYYGTRRYQSLKRIKVDLGDLQYAYVLLFIESF